MKFAWSSIRFAFINELFSRESMMIGVFGFGQIGSFGVEVFEKMFSICFIIAGFFGILFLGFRNPFLFLLLLSAFVFLCFVLRSGRFRLKFF